MDTGLFKAASSGDWDAIKEYESQLYSQRTPNQNNVLHVVAFSCDSSFPVEKILEIHPKLLLELNSRDETALHYAARKGHPNVVRALIESAKQSNDESLRTMLNSRSKNGNLVLHEAIDSNNLEIIQLLIQECPDHIHILNNQKQSPLYLAVDKGYHDVAALMLSTWSSLSSAFLSTDLLNEANGFKTALHAAAIRNNRECVKMITQKHPILLKKVDEMGWSPLHYAAKFNHQEVTKQLLIADRSMAYVKSKSSATEEKNGKRTALHVAVFEGNIQIIEEILSYCPDSWETVTGEGKNVIHLAVENGKKEVLELILGKSWATDLINQKDIHGKTPLELYAARHNLLGNSNVNHHEVLKTAMNNLAGCSPRDLKIVNSLQIVGETNFEGVSASEGPKDVTSGNKDQKELERTKSSVSSFTDADERKMNIYLIVATLIITVSFAAGFTIPGGYESNDGKKKGVAVLVHRPAFQAFIVFDALAMMASSAVVAMILIVPKGADGKGHLSYLRHCKYSITFALLSLGISFFTGLYVTVPQRGITIFLYIHFMPLIFLGAISVLIAIFR